MEYHFITLSSLFSLFWSFNIKQLYLIHIHYCMKDQKELLLHLFILLDFGVSLYQQCQCSPTNWHLLCHIAVHFHPQWLSAENGSSLWCSQNQPIKRQLVIAPSNQRLAARFIAQDKEVNGRALLGHLLLNDAGDS